MVVGMLAYFGGGRYPVYVDTAFYLAVAAFVFTATEDLKRRTIRRHEVGEITQE
jgi:hypothetical protein